jgi:hypothetical protein
MLWWSSSLFSVGAEYTGILSVHTQRTEVGRTWGLYLENYMFLSGYILMWPFVPVLAWETRSWSLSKYFRHTLYIYMHEQDAEKLLALLVNYISINFSPMAQQPLLGLGLFITEASRSHSDTPHSVGLLWASDQRGTETSTWQHTTLTRDRHPCPCRDSNPQSQ